MEPNNALTAELDSTKCACGAESDYGAHGVSNGEIYDEYYCEACWNNKGRVEPKEEVEETKDASPVCGGSTPKDNEVRPSQEVSDLVEYYYKLYESRLSSQSGRHV